MAQTLIAQWGIAAPSYDELPSRELDLAVDAWCLIQARDLRAVIDPPPDVRPWMVARLVMAAATTMQLAETQEHVAPPLGERAIVQWLCGEWNGALRDRWAAIGRMRRRKRIRDRIVIGILVIVAAILLAAVIAERMRHAEPLIR